MRPMQVTFAGAGPGAPDLLTLRAAAAIRDADVIVYAGSLVNPAVLTKARAKCKLVDSSSLALPEILKTMIAAARSGKRVLRLHTGDPALYGAIAEQMAGLRAAGISYQVIPGVTSALAAAAELGVELTLPGASQTVIMTRRAGRTPVPKGQDIQSLAAHQATMALFLSVDEIGAVVSELRKGGFPANTPAAAIYRASWPDQKIVRAPLSSLAQKVKAAGFKRQTMVLVGRALEGNGEKSLLYDPAFTHGYRKTQPELAALPDSTEQERFLGKVAVYALTKAGCCLAKRMAAQTRWQLFCSKKYAKPRPGLQIFEPEKFVRIVEANWAAFDGHVFIMSSGIVVRKIAGLLSNKTTDPAVVVCDENATHSISLLGGHIAGANRLAAHVADLVGAAPVITTATDAQGLPAFDEISARMGWHIENPETIKLLNGLLPAAKPVAAVWPKQILARFYAKQPSVHYLAPGAALPAKCRGATVLDAPMPPKSTGKPVLRVSRLPIVVGLGFNKGVSAQTLESAVSEALKEFAAPDSVVRAIATIDLKKHDPALAAFASRKAWPVQCHRASALAQVRAPNPSETVNKAIGTPSVCEAAAILSSSGRLIMPKRKFCEVTVALAVEPAQKSSAKTTGKIYAIGIGPGADLDLTGRAAAALNNSQVVIGYRPYCETLGNLLEGKRVLASGMRQEIARCETALSEAIAGARVAVVSSGDAGIYGMAGLLLELAQARGLKNIQIEIVPGITAATAAASILGAPLANDFAVISLSDLLTKKADIRRRLKAAAGADMVSVLYNPRSHNRRDLLEEALAIFAKTGGSKLPCGLVRNASRPNQWTWVGRIASLPIEEVDMSTVVLFGNSRTRNIAGRLVTVRGYKIKKQEKLSTDDACLRAERTGRQMKAECEVKK